MNHQIMIVAAEASSAHYATRLMQHWQSQKRPYHFFGVGTQEMEKIGFERLGKAEEMAVVGVMEVIAHYSDLKAVFERLVAEASSRRPSVVILMDYPDFNLRLAKKLKAMGIKVFYYISPQVWAWRKSRIHDIKAYCEKVFLLFPFEKKFYDEFDVPNEFVGHPLLEDLDPALLDKEKINVQRQRYGIQANDKVLALMPGSRHGELERNFPIQLEVARNLLKANGHLRLIICVAPTLEKEHLLAKLEDFKSPYILLKEDPNKMISLADYVLAASGTATLMVGLLEKPMVIMYRMKWLTGVLGKLLVRGIRFFGLVNLILDKEVVPERMQGDASAEKLTLLMQKYIDDPVYTESVIADLKTLKNHLGDRGATARVAKALDAYIGADS